MLTKRPLVKFLDSKKIQLGEEFIFEWRGLRLIVPEGYISDGVTVPRIFWRFIRPFDGNMVYPSIVHDFICDHLRGFPKGSFQKLWQVRQGASGMWDIEPRLIGWDEGADIFNLAMKRYGTSPWKRAVAYKAVKYYGRLKGD